MRHFYSQFVSPGSLCFDVGANWGNRTRVLRALGARVVAVEPQAECARLLGTAYCLDCRVRVLRVALGDAEGEAEMMIASADTVSSLSRHWIEEVRASGRFAGVNWDKRELVKVTTLDKLMHAYGVPRFVKIDVEGYEHQVLRGLSSPVPYLSFEFTPESSASAYDSIDELSQLGMGLFNYSVGESMRLALTSWVGASELKSVLSQLFADEPMAFGDVYSAAEHRG